jgi:flagellar capping protein FliD
MSGSGWSNTAGIERMLRNLREKGITEVVVFTLTDYDPFGFAIAKEFVDKCTTLGLYVVEHHRIGINAEHTTPEILHIQKYPVKRGRRLSVNGVRFDSDRWLAEYGIERAYGLEIEAVSAQPRGHQYLREIVARELLNYLNETDRVEEITKTVWENAPFKSISEFVYSIDRNYPGRDYLLWAMSNAPHLLPEEYLSYEDYLNRYTPISEEMEQETADIDEEISDLEDQLSELQSEKETIEQPYREKLKFLSEQYEISRSILIHCLFKYYEKNKENWPRQNYALGYPAGCLLKAVEQQQDLGGFLKQIDDTKIISDIQSAFKDALANGEIKQLIEGVLNGGSSLE